MPSCLLHKTNPIRDTTNFYRVEICANLFQEFSVLREWGRVGYNGRQMIQLFPDLVAASSAADRLRIAKIKGGYQRG